MGIGAFVDSVKLEPGFRLDRYELLCPIAQGGMASVWLARLFGKHGFEKLVAVKTILPQYAQDLQFQRMFLDEARIASGIEHPNVAQILDLGEQNDVLYLVMEWVDGDSLSRLFRAVERRGEKVPVGVLGRILADTCAGLHAAHELAAKDNHLLGVVHRDVSPQNILVSIKGVAKLIDFGIAKARDRMAGETNAGNLKGKILYMAPEQALGMPVDRRADVWALGAVAYHILAGVPPYEGENQLATLHLLARPEPPAPLPAWVPKPIADVVMATLVHDREARIANAADVQRRLEHALAVCNLMTTTNDVSTYVRSYLGDRAEARKQAVELALEAAKDRARLQSMLGDALPPAASDSSSGVKPAPPPRAGHTVIDAPPALSNAMGEPVSTATLGSAALVTPAGIAPPLSDGNRRRVLIVGGVVATCGAILGIAGAALLHRPSSPASGGSPKATTTEHVQMAATKQIPPPPPVPEHRVPAPEDITEPASTAPAESAKPAITAPNTQTQSAPITQPPPIATPSPIKTSKPSTSATVKPPKTPKTIDDGF